MDDSTEARKESRFYYVGMALDHTYEQVALPESRYSMLNGMTRHFSLESVKVAAQKRPDSQTDQIEWSNLGVRP